MEKISISGVTADKNIACISVIGIEDKPGAAFRIFSMLARHNINIDIILQSVSRKEQKIFHLP